MATILFGIMWGVIALFAMVVVMLAMALCRVSGKCSRVEEAIPFPPEARKKKRYSEGDI